MPSDTRQKTLDLIREVFEPDANNLGEVDSYQGVGWQATYSADGVRYQLTYTPDDGFIKERYVKPRADAFPHIKRKLTLQPGVVVGVTHPVGSQRHGTTMQADYGLVLNSPIQNDKKRADIYLGDYPESSELWRISQVDPDEQEFDEFKYIAHCRDKQHAINVFCSHAGRSRFGMIGRADWDELIDTREDADRVYVRDEKGKFSKVGKSKKELFKEHYERLRKYDNSNLIVGDTSYKELVESRGKVEADKALDKLLQKLASVKAGKDFNKQSLDLAEQAKKDTENRIQKSKRQAFIELYPHLIDTRNRDVDKVFNTFGKVFPDKLERLLEDYSAFKQKQREEKIRQREERRSQREEKARQREKRREEERVLAEQKSAAKDVFDKAPEVVKKAFRRFGHPNLIAPDPDASAYFSPWGGVGIHMDSEPVGGLNFAKIYRHEWGHYVDSRLAETGLQRLRGGISNSDTGRKALASDKKALSRKEYNQIMSAFKSKVYDEDYNRLFLEDIAKAVSRKFGYGHSDEYFSMAGKRETEVFANIVALLSSNDSKFIDAARKIAPSSFEFVSKQLESI